MTNGIITEPEAESASSTNALLHVTHFTDPGCPFAFSSEPYLAALRWHYGDQIEWTTRLVVLSESTAENDAKAITPEIIQGNDSRLAREFGMPINTALRPHLLVARLPDLAIKAVQLNDPANADRFFRALRVAWMSDQRPIDEEGPLFAVATETGLDAAALKCWMDDPATMTAYESDKRAARSPQPAALVLDHKLADAAGERRYTCPSLEFSPIDDPGRVITAPGFQSHNAYEVAVANTAPEIERRDPADDPLEVLEWADWPLAAAEVARIMDVDRESAVAELTRSGAVNDRGYWRAP